MLVVALAVAVWLGAAGNRLARNFCATYNMGDFYFRLPIDSDWLWNPAFLSESDADSLDAIAATNLSAGTGEH
ncbi:MAG: hypothetical protein AB1609_13420 [Bacillota bacterium]